MGTESFADFLESLDEDHLRKIGIYHEVRSQYTKEGQVL